MIYKTIKTVVSLSVAAMFLMTSAHAAGTLIGSSVPFAKNSNVREAVKKECQIETKLPNFIKEAAKKEGVSVTPNKEESSKSQR